MSDRTLAQLLAYSPGFLLSIAFLFLPTRWLKVPGALVLAGFVASYVMWQDSQGDRIQIGAALATLIVQQLVVATLAALAIRYFIRWVRPRSPDHSEAAKRSPLAEIIAALLLTPLIPVWVIYSAPFARLPGIAMLAILGAIVIILVVAGTRWFRRGFLARCSFAAGTAALLACLALYAIQTGRQLEAIAANAAEGRPYCLMAGSREVTAPLDMTVLNMRARDWLGPPPDYNALLIIEGVAGTEFYNWSYHGHAFVKANITYELPPLCSPRRKGSS